MTLRAATRRLLAAEELNFLLTNRIPRDALTRFMGWFSKRENPLVRDASIALWQFFCDVDLTEAEKDRFESLHDAFVRKLKPGARPADFDPAVLASPSDAIVGAFGPVTSGMVQQVKGFDYSLAELFGDGALAREMEGGWFATLRLTAGMYHRFHAPHDLVVEQVRYISGERWNVNPPALKRIERLYCRNERAAVSTRLGDGGERMLLVPVAAVLVSSIRLPFLDPERPAREAGHDVWRGQAHFAKGEEMGWFEHGSTIVAFAPPGWPPVEDLETGGRINAGAPLFRKRG